MEKFYTGVGSRKTPGPILILMTKYAIRLSELGYTLRSGAAIGADTAFESGARSNIEFPHPHIYLPWPYFRGHPSRRYMMDAKLCSKAEKITAELHPTWNRCSPAIRMLHTRSVFQVMGDDLETPSSFVICWTLNGRYIGGTATAMKVADKFDVPVVNMGRDNYSPEEIAKLIL